MTYPPRFFTAQHHRSPRCRSCNTWLWGIIKYVLRCTVLGDAHMFIGDVVWGGCAANSSCNTTARSPSRVTLPA